MSTRPTVAISMGDPTGIGPEVTLRALAHRGVRRDVRPILVGDPGVYRRAANRLESSLRLSLWSPPDPLPSRGVALHPISALRANDCRLGAPTSAGGHAAHTAILAAVALIQKDWASALVTAPICKANLAEAGVVAVGHTELLAQLAGEKTVRMMMVGPVLRVSLVTTHMALAKVPGSLSRRGILDTILVTDQALRRQFHLRRPRIGVAGLNPHAGEHGLFGDEEQRLIRPAVQTAVRRGVRAVGPLAADSLFALAAMGKFDATVCMYHDQGLGPFKTLHFADGVNFTAGLPFVRTSPDHGTAHDIARRFAADSRSMIEAIRLAGRLAARSHSARLAVR